MLAVCHRTRLFISCLSWLLLDQTALVMQAIDLGIMSRVCVRLNKEITERAMIHMPCSAPQQWDHDTITDSLFLYVLFCLTETVCDHHLQQAHSRADGLLHRVSKPQWVCLLTKSTLCSVQISHMKVWVNAELEGPFGWSWGIQVIHVPLCELCLLLLLFVTLIHVVHT